jgi:hypothetical protein
MRDNSKKFSIERIDSNSWNWKEVYSKIFNHTKKVKQPGEPVESEFSFENLAKEQILNFVLSPKNATSLMCIWNLTIIRKLNFQ